MRLIVQAGIAIILRLFKTQDVIKNGKNRKDDTLMKHTKMLAAIMAALMLAAAMPAAGVSAVTQVVAQSSADWTSDTTSDLTVQPGKSYQFKFTASDPDAIRVWTGTPGVFNITKTVTEPNAVYYKITAIGTPGAAAGVYVSYQNGSGTKLCVATVAGGSSAVTQPSTGWISDTTSDLTVQSGKSYQFKFTASDPNAIKVWMGTPGVFNITKTATETNAVYYKITAIGTPGAATGVYVSYQNGSGTKLCVATVAGSTSGTTSQTPNVDTTGMTQYQKDAIKAGLTLGAWNHAFEQEVFELVNQERAKAGLPALVWARSLTDTAQTRAKELETLFSHTRPDGTQSSWENIAMGAGGGWFENAATGEVDWHIANGTPSHVMDSWMNSPGHRANILDPNAKAIAIGCYVGEDGGVYWVQNFTNNAEDMVDPLTSNTLLGK